MSDSYNEHVVRASDVMVPYKNETTMVTCPRAQSEDTTSDASIELGPPIKSECKGKSRGGREYSPRVPRVPSASSGHPSSRVPHHHDDPTYYGILPTAHASPPPWPAGGGQPPNFHGYNSQSCHPSQYSQTYPGTMYAGGPSTYIGGGYYSQPMGNSAPFMDYSQQSMPLEPSMLGGMPSMSSNELAALNHKAMEEDLAQKREHNSDMASAQGRVDYRKNRPTVSLPLFEPKVYLAANDPCRVDKGSMVSDPSSLSQRRHNQLPSSPNASFERRGKAGGLSRARLGGVFDPPNADPAPARPETRESHWKAHRSRIDRVDETAEETSRRLAPHLASKGSSDSQSSQEHHGRTRPDRPSRMSREPDSAAYYGISSVPVGKYTGGSSGEDEEYRQAPHSRADRQPPTLNRNNTWHPSTQAGRKMDRTRVRQFTDQSLHSSPEPMEPHEYDPYPTAKQTKDPVNPRASGHRGRSSATARGSEQPLQSYKLSEELLRKKQREEHDSARSDDSSGDDGYSCYSSESLEGKTLVSSRRQSTYPSKAAGRTEPSSYDSPRDPGY